MAFTPKNWQNVPSASTPISAAALEDLETRVTDYGDDLSDARAADIAVIGEVFSCDTSGSTDEASALQTAIDNVDSQGGGAFLLPATPYGTGYINIGTLVDIPQAVNFRGQGMRETRLKATASGAGLRFNAWDGITTNSRGGRCGDFHMDGGDTATTCMDVHVAVNREFSSFRVSDIASSGIGLLVRGAQNTSFHDFDIQADTGSATLATGLKVTNSVGSCRFSKYSILGCDYAGIWVTQTDSGGQYGIGYPEPRYISFDDGIVEHGDPDTCCAVRIHSGRDLWFSRQALFVATDQASSGAYSIVEINDSGAGGTRQVYFDRGQASGGTDPSKNSTAFDIQEGSAAYYVRISNWQFGNNTYGVVAANGQTKVELDAYNNTSTDTIVSIAGTGEIISRAVGTTSWTTTT